MVITSCPFSPLPNNKILVITKLKVVADDKLNIAKMTISPLDRVENSVGKVGNAGYQLSLPTVFSKTFFFRVVQGRDCVVESLEQIPSLQCCLQMYSICSLTVLTS